MVMRVLGVEVSLGYLKVSDLVFCYVLVRPSLILHCAWYAIVGSLVGVSSVAVSVAPAVAAHLGQLQDPLGCCTTVLAVSACPAPALEVWGGQLLFLLYSQCLVCAGWPGNVRWVPHPVRLPFVGDYWLLL